MTDKEKVKEALELIRSEGLDNRRITMDEVYKELREMSIDDIARELANFVNLIYDLRAILEGKI